MEQFSLEKYLENQSRKVVTRRGSNVRIICWDRKHGEDDLPIVFLEERDDGEFLLTCKSDGTVYYNHSTLYDLFFADEEEGLTEFEKCVQNILNEPHLQDVQAVKQFSKTLLDLARKEILKDLPKWKKVDSNPPKVQYNLQGKRLYKNGEYYIELSDLETLPKEE